MITDTAAIVLKGIAYSESSMIVTLLSEKHGKIAVMARGARRNKGKFGGLLQPGAVLDVSYYYKNTRDIQNLSEAAQRKATWRIQQNMEKMALCLATLELCEQLCHEYEPMPEIFCFLENLQVWLHETVSTPKLLLPYIQFQLARLAGIGIAWQADEMHNKQDSSEPETNGMYSGYLNIENGSISHEQGSGLNFRLTKSQMQYLRCIVTGRKKNLLNMDIPVAEYKNLIHQLDAYLQYHLEGLRPRKSDAIFDQIL